jgi:asparagine synthase (glutamine-hydrolysing)
MCGIAGIWNLDGRPVNYSELRKFTDSLIDRGPDGSGYKILDGDSLGLGHRRLSILDLSDAACQPMSYSDGRYWITYNGEIYNFIEIAKELKSKGYVFSSDSDTEVILAAFQCWGKPFLHKLNGMFAFAIWDSAEKKLLLARDRFGVKPLHYRFENRRFTFASETFAFKFLEGTPRQIDESKMAIAVSNPDYLEGSGHTIFQGLYQLLPGHYMELSPTSASAVQRKWWETLDHLPAVPKDYSTQVERFIELFEDACRIRLRSDVQVASALSGGMDSSAIFCIVSNYLKSEINNQRIANKLLHAFIAYFPDTPNDEKRFAEQVIGYTCGNATYVEPDYTNLISELQNTTHRFDAIAGTPIMCATDVYKAMYKDGIRVSMDGHGADEMLYGYKQMVFNAYQTATLKSDRTYANDLLQTYTDLFFDDQKTEAAKALDGYGKSIAPKWTKKVAMKIVPKLVEKRNSINFYDALCGQSLRHGWLDINGNMHLDPLSASHFRNFRTGNAERDTYNLFHYTSLPVNLRDFDRASMQNSIEIRSPFMDWRLVTYVFGLPLKSKVGSGFTKKILRDAMKGKMPESIRTRKLKIGLSAPLQSWFNGPLQEYLLDITGSAGFRSTGIWRGNEIHKFVHDKSGSGWASFDECSPVWKYVNAYIVLKANNKVA